MTTNNILWAIEKEAAIWRPWDYAELPKSPVCACSYNELRITNEEAARIADQENYLMRK